MTTQIDMCFFGELWDMPMKRLEKRMPGANPTRNKKRDSHVQPSRQVRKINKKLRIVRKIAMMLMVLYRLVLFNLQSVSSVCHVRFKVNKLIRTF